jgi:hypothetical protein
MCQEKTWASSIQPRLIEIRIPRNKQMRRVLLLMAAASLGTAFGQGTTYIPVAEGSTTTPRLNVDGDSGQVYIYTGGFFPRGPFLGDLRFFGDLRDRPAILRATLRRFYSKSWQVRTIRYTSSDR